MSIKAIVEKTKKSLRECREAILGRGGEIPATAGLKDLPEAIYNVPADASLAFQEDSEIAYRKTVPENAEEYALVSEIGGMSYKGDFVGLRDTRLTGLISEGANLIPFSSYANADRTYNGLNYYNDGVDGGITISGSTSGGNAAFTVYKGHINAGTYTYSNNIPDGFTDTLLYSISFNIQYYDKTTGAWVKNITGHNAKYGHTVFTVSEEESENYNLLLNINVPDNTAVDNMVIYPMLARGSEVKEYKAYVGTLDTLEIPETVQALDGYGAGVNETYYNSIEWTGGKCKFVQRTKRLIIDGTESFWKAYSTSWEDKNANDEYCYFINQLSDKMIAYQSSICNMFNNSNGCFNPDWGNSIAGNYCDHPTIANFYFVVSGYSSVDAWKSHLAELYASGNPLVIEYALAEPIETDISDLLADSRFLKVEGGGTLASVNEYSKDAPTTVKYTVKVGS